MVDATGPTLLPASFRARLSGQPEGDPVALGDLDALRYEGLQPKGASRPVTVYAVPTTDGVATVTCSASRRLTARRVRGDGHDARALGGEAVPARSE